MLTDKDATLRWTPCPPPQLWGLWVVKGGYWLNHIHGDNQLDTPMTFICQEDAELQAEVEHRDCGEIIVALIGMAPPEDATPLAEDDAAFAPFHYRAADILLWHAIQRHKRIRNKDGARWPSYPRNELAHDLDMMADDREAFLEYVAMIEPGRPDLAAELRQRWDAEID